MTCVYMSLLMVLGRGSDPMTDEAIVLNCLVSMIGLFCLGYLLGLFAEFLFEQNEQAMMAE